jgi:hypothetical protein
VTLRINAVLSVVWSIVGGAMTGNAAGAFGVSLAVVVAYFLLGDIRWLWYLVDSTPCASTARAVIAI